MISKDRRCLCEKCRDFIRRWGLVDGDDEAVVFIEAPLHLVGVSCKLVEHDEVVDVFSWLKGESAGCGAFALWGL